MSNNLKKKYYWLKLKKDFFKRHDMMIIEDMPNGTDYVLFYLKLMMESLSHNGHLRFSETIPYNERMLSTITNTNIDVVRSAITLFGELDLLDILDDKTIYLNEVSKLTGSEDSNTKYVTAYRKRKSEKKISLQCKGDVRKCKSDVIQCKDDVQNLVRADIDIDIDTDIDIDKDKDIDKEVNQEKPAPPTFMSKYNPKINEPSKQEIIKQAETICYKMDEEEAEKFLNYYGKFGWEIKGSPIRDWRKLLPGWKANNNNFKVSGIKQPALKVMDSNCGF